MARSLSHTTAWEEIITNYLFYTHFEPSTLQYISLTSGFTSYDLFPLVSLSPEADNPPSDAVRRSVAA